MNLNFKKRLWLLFLAIVVVALFWVWPRQNSQPSYHGRTLSQWIQSLPAPNTARGLQLKSMVKIETDEQIAAKDAVRHIGTNAVPYLLAEMRAKDTAREQLSRFWEQVKTVWQKLLSRGNSKSAVALQLADNQRSSGELRHWDAARGFHALGPLGKSAIPELIKSLNDSSLNKCPDAAYALSAMGPEGIAKMQPILTNNAKAGFNWPQFCVIWSLGQTPSAGRQAVPDLLALLKSTNAIVRRGVVWTLGELKTNEDLIAPALAAQLGDPGMNIRLMAEEALRNYGIESVTRSSLREYLDDPRVSVRMAATNALIALFPDEAAKVGQK